MTSKQIAIVGFVLLSVIQVDARQGACLSRQPSLGDFTVYSSHSLQLKRSEFQGLTGAGGDIQAADFLFEKNNELRLAVSAGGKFSLNHGKVNAALESGQEVKIESSFVAGVICSNEKIRILNSSVSGVLYSPIKPSLSKASYLDFKKEKPSEFVDHVKITQQMKEFSEEYAKEKEHQISISDTVPVKLQDKLSILNLDGKELSQKRILMIEGNKGQSVVINVHGDSLRLVDLDIKLRGGIPPQQILWNFSETQKLLISKTHNHDLGWPGTVLAPRAEVEFYDGLITGALYVSDLKYVKASGVKKTGQVSDARFQPLKEK